MKNLLKDNNRIINLLVIVLVVIVIIVACLLVKSIVKGEIGLSDWASIVTIIGIFGVAAKYLISDYWGHKNKSIRKEEAINSFNTNIANLSSPDNTTKLSAAIMLRRFLSTRIGEDFPFLHEETIKVISSNLKVLPTGVFQKTLADGLAYAKDLSNVDLMRTNLQDAYLGRKDDKRIIMNDTDLFLSDLSYALLQHIQGNAIFYRAILFCTRIKDCDLTGANFCEADLTNVRFDRVILKDADFRGAINIPQAIAEKLVQVDLKDGNHKMIYPDAAPVTAKRASLDKTIFFSMPSIMSKEDELITKDYQHYLEKDLGYHVIYYVRDDYPSFGQLGKIREKVLYSSAMVVFGFKQMQIHDATYRPFGFNIKKSDIWLATPWNEIEVGMGLMNGLPILLVKDPQINTGIFDDKLSECFVSTILTTEDSRDLAQNHSMVEWLSRIN